MPEASAEDLRRLAPQVLGAVVRRYGHFDTAEDAVQEALLAAAVQWPRDGVPGDPRGWLIKVASRRLTDLLRSEQARQRREDTVFRWTPPEQWVAPAADRAGADDDPAHQPGQAEHQGQWRAVQPARGQRARGTARRGAARAVPDLQRGLRQHL